MTLMQIEKIFVFIYVSKFCYQNSVEINSRINRSNADSYAAVSVEATIFSKNE